MDPAQPQISASSWSRPLVRVAKDMSIDAGLVCVLIAAGLYGARRWRLARVAGWLGLAVLVMFASPLTSNLLRAPLLRAGAELATTANDCSGHPGPVVVLGGGATAAGLPAFETMERVHAAAGWIATNHPALVVMSGGPTTSAAAEVVTEAGVMIAFARSILGNKAEGVRFIAENHSLNTHDNAIFSRDVLHQESLSPAAPLRVVLVTSQVHMPRAAATFEKAGFEVCAVIAPEVPPAAGFVSESGWLNFATARKTSTTLNEWFGIAGYWFGGWL
ncbi:YdcF family protein [bacterium]|nr:YdcF family protein [bacterium]